MKEKKTELKMIKMSEVQSQEIEWLWKRNCYAVSHGTVQILFPNRKKE